MKTTKILAIVVLVLASAANAADPNLVGWWKLDETSGTTAADSSGKGNNGTVVGRPQWAAGHIDGALRFSGNGYVSLPIGSVISSLAESTFAIWVNWSGRTDPNRGGWQRIFDFGTDTGNYIYLCPSTGESKAAMRVAIVANNNTWDEFDANTGPLPKGWHHVAVTVSRSSRTIIMYLDGNDVGSKTDCVNTIRDLGATTNNWLGKSQYDDPNFNGSLDDFRIYNRALSRAEIRALLAQTKKKGTAFMHQERLLGNNTQADGLYDFQFKLYGDLILGAQSVRRKNINSSLLVEGQVLRG
jgi:hypothetical protein